MSLDLQSKTLQRSENASEKEIVINIQEEEQEKTSEKTGENNTENNNIASVEEQKEGGQKATPSNFVEKKSINSLSDEERALIIANAKSGVDQPYFNVKFFKNGRTQITKKKETPQTVSTKITSQKAPAKKDSPVYYTDNQLLFEHIIELNAKVERLMQKHKKLKRRYDTLQDDLYIDSEAELATNNDSEVIQQNIPQKTIQLEETQQEETQQNIPVRSSRNIKNGSSARGWRSQIAFL